VAAVTLERRVARERIDLRADSEWVARVQRQADRLGVSLSAYIRQATTERLEQDEATDPRAGRPADAGEEGGAS